jgi:predicted XRE-type DNA-binding protein
MNGIGDKFDDFMKEEGIYEEARAIALKKIIVFQFEQEMRKQNLTKASIARKMKKARNVVDNILNPKYNSTIGSLERFAAILGKKLTISIE